jgi:hypothetical protein
VINLFDLGRRCQQGEPDYYINEYINRQFMNESTIKPSTSNNQNVNINKNNLNVGNDSIIPVLKKESVVQEKQQEEVIFNMDTGRTNLNINLNLN